MTENDIARNKLINILQTNADLPLMALVDSDVVADDCYVSWFGDVNDAYISEVWAGKEKTYFIDEVLDNMIDFIDIEFPEKSIGNIYDLSDEEIDKWMKKAEKFILSLPWKKYIVLTVTTPDSLEK